MPSEIRHLTFTRDEVSTAIRSYCLGAGQLFPADATFVLDTGPNPAVRVSSRIGARQRETSTCFSGEALIAPLVRFCQKQRIPLPAAGAKEVATFDDQLILIIRLH